MAKSKIDQFAKGNKKNTNPDNKTQLMGGDQNSVNAKLLSGFNMLSEEEDEDLTDQRAFKRGFRVTKNLSSLGMTDYLQG